MLFKHAVEHEIIRKNPFATVGVAESINNDDELVISRAAIDQLLRVCNPMWRVIVVLARYGGLRCPSEVLSLKWEDCNFDAGRIVVTSPKTEHHEGKGTRVIPLFPELRAELIEARELAQPGSVYVVDGPHRSAANSVEGWKACNMRTQFIRLIKRAGLKPWPKPFQTLRQSRETELAAEYPIHVVVKWIGNSVKVAMRHYLKTQDVVYERAAATTGETVDAEVDASATQHTTRQHAAQLGNDCQEKKKAPEKQGPNPLSSVARRSVPEQLMGIAGFDQYAFSSEETAIPVRAGTKSGTAVAHGVETGVLAQLTIADPDLLEVVTAWPRLTTSAKSQVLSISRRSRLKEARRD